VENPGCAQDAGRSLPLPTVGRIDPNAERGVSNGLGHVAEGPGCARRERTPIPGLESGPRDW
jgi:hypothetical protein